MRSSHFVPTFTLAALLAVALSLASAPTPASASTGTFVTGQTVVYSGLSRTYSYYVPKVLSPSPALWLMLHPTVIGSTSPQVFDKSPMQKLADTYGFIVVWPVSSYVVSSNSWYWDAYFLDYAFLLPPDDSGYIRSLIIQFTLAYGIDPSAIYVAGMSSGAFMAERVAADSSDLVAAVGAASGQIYSENSVNLIPPLSSPVSAILLNGDMDLRVGYCGQRNNWARSTSPASDVTLQYWATANACTDSLPQLCAGSQPTPDVNGADAISCAGGVEVLFIRETGVGHTWVSGTESVLWTFFSAHHKPTQ